MQLKISTDYAIRAILYLAVKKEIISSNQISEEMGIPGKYLINLSTKLRKAGLIHTHQGKHGGYTLARPPEKISVYDILLAMGDTIKINRSLEADGNRSRAGEKFGQLRRFYRLTQEKMEQYFKCFTIADLMADMDEKEMLIRIELGDSYHQMRHASSQRAEIIEGTYQS